jgi:hypothetical protein
MTATSPPLPELAVPLPRRSRWLVWTLLVVALIAATGYAVARAKLGPRAEVAAGYMARVTCSCRYVGGRDMASCLTDAEPGMEIVKVTEDAASKTITARVPLLASRRAQYMTPIKGIETGCTLLD